METPAPSRPAAPAVVAVVVTRNAGPWLEQAVEALAAQNYPNLAALYIDAASDEDPTPRIARAFPNAYVRRLDEHHGYGSAANEVREVVDGAAFYCFLHDDAAPEPGAIRTMVDEALRSNAGIVGCKLVQFQDHSRLLQVGESADKLGERISRVEPGELDQEQHDAVRDVFVVPGGCTLVRADLFAAIGGFDEGIDLLNDDLNLCWRAHVAGARVVVAPDAVVGHLEALGERLPVEHRRERLMRHRIRTMLSCYSRWHLVRVVPQALVTAVLEVVYSLLVGRRGQAGDVIRAWRWNWRRRDEIRSWRARVESTRSVPDAEIRRFQTRGSARFTAFVRGQTGRGGSRSERVQAGWRDLVDAWRRGQLRWPLAAWIVTLVIVAFGSRHLLLRPIAVVGGFLPFDLGPGDLLDEYLSGWRSVGLGSASPAPTAFGLLSGLGGLFLGAMGTLRRAVLLGSLLLGLVGAYRLLHPTGSRRAQAVALVVYGAVPLGYDAIADARWGSLTVYAATPWLLAQLARASGWAPFGPVGGEPGRGIRPHAPVARVVSIGLLVAVVAAIEPAIVPLTVIMVVALTLGSLAAGAVRGSVRVLVAGVGGAVVAAVLHVPWTLDFFLPGATWQQVVGRAGIDVERDLAELLRFHVGPVGGTALVFGLPVAAALSLLIGREWRFEWAVRSWALFLSLVGLTWAGGHGWSPVAMAPPETMLAPAAAGLAVAAGLGVVAFEVDLRAYGFGWRQLAAAVAGVALVVGAIPTMLDAGDGRWYLPSGGLEKTFAFLEEEPPGYRVLWIGDPDVMPLPGQSLDLDGGDTTIDAGGVDGGPVYATSDDGLPSITDGWVGPTDGSTELIEDALRLAAHGETSRLGQLLAPMAVRYIVLPTAAAPEPLGGVHRPTPPAVTDALADQLDLANIAVNPAYVVYRNDAALPARAVLPPGAGDRPTFETTAQDLVGAEPVLTERPGPTTFAGEVSAGSRILHSVSASDGWELQVEGRDATSTKLFGWAQGFQPQTGGDAVLRYDTSPLRYGVLGFQALFWLVAARVAWGVRRRGEREPTLGHGMEQPADAGAGTPESPQEVPT